MKRILLFLLIAVFLLAACAQTVATEETGTPEGTVEARGADEPTLEASPDPEPGTPDIESGDELIIYSGRSEQLVGPLLERFEEETGINVGVRYGSTAEMAATILEEGQNSPADVFYAQDAGALGALANANVLAPLPDDILNRVESRFRSPAGLWVGTSGRARVVAYNTSHVDPADLPPSIFGFTEPEWQGRIGWAPTNGSFQAFVTAMRVTHGEEGTREWLEGILDNDPISYLNNTAALAGTAAGEVDVSFINHYYLFRALEEQGEGYEADIYFPPEGDVGSLINVAGAAVLETSDNPSAAEQFIAFLLSEESQQYFSDTTFEYPLTAGVQPDPRLPDLTAIQTPDIDLSNLDDLQGTLRLLRDVGALE